MKTDIWNKSTRQAYIGTMLYSVLGVIASIISPIYAVYELLLGESAGGGSLILSIIEVLIIFGYVIFFLAIRNLVNLTEAEEKNAFKKMELSIFFNVFAAVFLTFHLNIVGGILNLASCILLVMAYAYLKRSLTLLEFSPSATSGFKLLFVSEILILIGICLGWIPVIKIIGFILQAIAWICVLVGWKRIAKPVCTSGETSCAEENFLGMVKDVFTESLEDAKGAAKDFAGHSEIIIEEIGTKAQEAKENIKVRLENNTSDKS